MAGFGYNDLGQRTSLASGTGTGKSVGYSYDSAARLQQQTINLAGTSADQTLGFTYNAAGQILTRTASNTAYSQAAPAAATTSYTLNVLNQYTNVGGVTPTYDNRGNLTNDGANSFTYDTLNRLTKIGTATTLSYDPAGRLQEKDGATDNIRYVYDGTDLIAEYDADTNTLLRRYVHGPGADEPLAWFEGSGTTDRRWLTADERGSVVAVTTSSGGVSTINSYDEYGVPGAGNAGRFGYTGQTWLPEGGLYHYKARAYSPKLGRFMQTDPIGYADNLNLYAYANNDPANAADPSGLAARNTPVPVKPKPQNPATSGLIEVHGRSQIVLFWQFLDLQRLQNEVTGSIGSTVAEAGGGDEPGDEAKNTACPPAKKFPVRTRHMRPYDNRGYFLIDSQGKLHPTASWAKRNSADFSHRVDQRGLWTDLLTIALSATGLIGGASEAVVEVNTAKIAKGVGAAATAGAAAQRSMNELDKNQKATPSEVAPDENANADCSSFG